MTSSRTVKTLAYLVAAMTAVTLVLSLVEPWTVSLRPRPAHAGQHLPSTLSAVRQGPWQSLELVLIPYDASRTAGLPESHVVIRADGKIQTTSLFDGAKPLHNGVMRVCAIYQQPPTDAVLQAWLKTCDNTGRRLSADIQDIHLKTLPQANSNAAQVKILAAIQRRLSGMIKSR